MNLTYKSHVLKHLIIKVYPVDIKHHRLLTMNGQIHAPATFTVWETPFVEDRVVGPWIPSGGETKCLFQGWNTIRLVLNTEDRDVEIILLSIQVIP
jgi:hypothetical protein